MYKAPQVLDKVQHASLKYTPVAGYGFARELATVPLVADEMMLATAHYPILFSPEGSAQPVAVLGLRGENVYLDAQDRWTVDYIPAFVRRYPFVLAEGNEPGQFFLAVDTAAPHVQGNGQGDGEALITPDGELGAPAKSALTFLRVFKEGLLRTNAVLQALADAGVLVDKTLTIQDGTTSRLIGGFRVVDEGKLKALDDATLALWARNGVLQAVYSHWASLRHLNTVAIASGKPDTAH